MSSEKLLGVSPLDLAVKLNEFLGWPGVTAEEKEALVRMRDQELERQRQLPPPRTTRSVLGTTE